jgi:hypothetical protein
MEKCDSSIRWCDETPCSAYEDTEISPHWTVAINDSQHALNEPLPFSPRLRLMSTRAGSSRS